MYIDVIVLYHRNVNERSDVPVFLHHEGYGPTFEGLESRCRICDVTLKPAKNGLYGKVMSDHLKMHHDGMGREQYHIEAFFNGARPTCCCMRCVASSDPAPVSWTSNGFRRFATGHNRTITEKRAPDITTSENKCCECGVGFGSLRGLASHIKPTHKMTTEEYVIKHMYGGEAPQCALEGCEDTPRFDRSTWTFKRFCVNHAHIAEALGGKKGGVAPNPNRGKTKEDGIPHLIQRSIEYAGSGNPFFGRRHTDETKKLIADLKRLTREEFTKRTTRKPDEYVVLTSYDNYDSRQQPLDVRCQLCNLEFQATLENLDRDCSRCVKCFPSSGRSRAEEEIATFIEGLGVDVVRNDRSVLDGKEIDIWVPSKNFGVEYNGLWWHCEANSPDPDRMRSKLDAQRVAGVNILHVFEDEWLNRRDIIEGMIRCRLGLPVAKLHARDCHVAEVSAEVARSFLDENHLDGVGGSCPLRFGLFDRHETLVAVITFRRPQQHTKWPDHIEVKRFATLCGVSVRGALGKLIKHVRQHLQCAGQQVNIMTYVHLRHGEGTSYESVGFVKRHETRRGFWWTTGGGRRLHRLKVKADAARGLSERDVAAQRGVHRIYDCGVATFELKCGV